MKKYGKTMDDARHDVAILMGLLPEEPPTEPPEKPAPQGNAVVLRTLTEGCTGEDVRALQILLAGRDCNGHMHKPDGIFGPNTLGAVKLFQQKTQLPVTGEIPRESGKSFWGWGSE